MPVPVPVVPACPVPVPVVPAEPVVPAVPVLLLLLELQPTDMSPATANPTIPANARVLNSVM